MARVARGESHPPVHRPPRPARRRCAPLGELAHEPALVLARRHPRDLRRRSTRDRGTPSGTTRCGCSARSRRTGSPSWPRTRSSWRGSRRPSPTCALPGPSQRWYQRRADAGEHPLPRAIAYFSPEFGITAVLPQYSGGLGILAGDHLKAASDLGVPIIGVGLLYRPGYFSQSLSREGWQQERYPALDPHGLPLTLLREADGAPVRVADRPARRPQPASPRSGRRRSAGCRCCCSTPTSRRTPRRARGHRPALRRRHRAPAAPGAAAGHRRRPRAARLLPRSPARPSPRSSTPTRATPASSAWSGSASYAEDEACRSTRPWRPPAPARSSPPTPRCRPASTGSRAT